MCEIICEPFLWFPTCSTQTQRSALEVGQQKRLLAAMFKKHAQVPFQDAAVLFCLRIVSGKGVNLFGCYLAMVCHGHGICFL